MAKGVSKNIVLGPIAGFALLTLFEDADCSLSQLVKKKLIERKGRGLEKDLLHIILSCSKSSSISVGVHMNCLCLRWETTTWRTLIKNARNFLEKNPGWEYARSTCDDNAETTVELMDRVLSGIEKFLDEVESTGCRDFHFKENRTPLFELDAKRLKASKKGILFREKGFDTMRLWKENEEIEFLRDQLRNSHKDEDVNKTIRILTECISDDDEENDISPEPFFLRCLETLSGLFK